ncbi:hypothetical protein [Methanosarcina siciliae]|uniref:hypothetical protein n=1 Tax=Methanosarcina siciliae TaxID=38027 RepID=UPI000B0E7F1A|nr:hypothetical protein [Methanosarcina siciliae]
MAGPAEDVVEKWPWPKKAEYDSHTLYTRSGRETPGRRRCGKRGLKGLEKGERQEVQGV